MKKPAGKTQRPARRSPLGAAPPRQAGTSLRDHLTDEVIETSVLMGVGIGAMIVMVLAFAIRNVVHFGIVCVLLTAVLLCVILPRMKKFPEHARRIRLGMEGEIAVAAVLEELRECGYFAVHDVVFQSFNIDHVLVGPGGVYAIETKTISKPIRGNPPVRFHEGKVQIPDRAPTDEPIRQVKGAAKRVRDILQRETGRTVWVTPVLLYPGWWVDEKQSPPDFWLLNPYRLRQKLQDAERRGGVLPDEDIQLFRSRLEGIHWRGA